VDGVRVFQRDAAQMAVESVLFHVQRSDRRCTASATLTR
jgi:hypothetical protein